MIHSDFLSRKDHREFLPYVKRQREDHGVARRTNVLLLLDDGKPCVEIAQVLHLDDDTVRGWHKQYVTEGWDAVAYGGWNCQPTSFQDLQPLQVLRPTTSRSRGISC